MNEQPENDKTEVRKDKEVGPRRPLLRSRNDRKIWGVAGGLAEHFGFNPTLVRVFFVVTLFFGGAGLLAYLVLAVALPEDDGTSQPVPESIWTRLGKVVLVCVLVAVGLFLAAGLAVVSAWVTATGHGTVIAIAVIVFGLRWWRRRSRETSAGASFRCSWSPGSCSGSRRERSLPQHPKRPVHRPALLHPQQAGRNSGRRPPA